MTNRFRWNQLSYAVYAYINANDIAEDIFDIVEYLHGIVEYVLDNAENKIHLHKIRISS
jgi:hypothetical protein